MNEILLQGGRILDPAAKRDVRGDLLLKGGKISAGKPSQGALVVKVDGLVVTPGLIDPHVHLREPGQSAKETIATGTAAAVAGGFTSVIAMPNTSPVADGPNTIAWMRQRAKETGVANVFPTGAISLGQKGEALAPIGALRQAGVVAITDDGHCIQSAELMRRALEYARMFDLPVLDHCEDKTLSAGGVMNEGKWSRILGLPGWPGIAEEVIVARNALLAELTGARVICQHLSSAGSVRILKEARSRGVRIDGEASPHHLALTEERVEGYDANFKMNPPLRTEADARAIREAVADGTIRFLATDHAPHCSYEKEVEFDEAPFGVVGLETALGVYLTELVHRQRMSLTDVVAKMTQIPSDYFGLGRGTLQEGAPADVTVIDPERKWTVKKGEFRSRSRNTPFEGRELKGRAVFTIVGGEIRHDLDGRAPKK
ncbi:MAG: dihydroorotase [Verrucomicrobia bacterium]|jgi:dihydroorotase|nr:dihydroorotase [Verrucomicrobiota bacterium]